MIVLKSLIAIGFLSDKEGASVPSLFEDEAWSAPKLGN